MLLLVAVILFGAALSPAYLRSTNFFYVGLNVGEVAIMALPLALVIITAEIDLSVASVLGLSGVVLAELYTHGWPIWAAIVVALVVGVACGLFNGLLVTRLGLPSLAVTIGTLALFRGIAQIILPNDTVAGFPPELTKIGIEPIPGTQIPYSIAIFGDAGHPRRRRPARHAARARDLRDRRQPGGRVLLGHPGQAHPPGRSSCSPACSRPWPGCSGPSGSRRRATTPASAWSSRSSPPACSGASRSSAGAGRSSASCSPWPSSAPCGQALTLDNVSAQQQQIVVGSLLLISVIVPSASGVYQRARGHLRSVRQRRRAAREGAAASEGEPA